MSLRFTLRQLEYFVAVGETGSIAAASERIRISPPSISVAISQLESEFKIQLFIRKHAQGLTLTPGGKRFFAEAKTLLHDAEALHDLAGEISGSVRGRLRVGSLITLAPLVMPKLRSSFETTHEGASIQQSEGDQATLLDSLRTGDIDVALTYDMGLQDDIRFLPLATLPPYVLMSPQHPLVGRKTVSLEDLAPHPLVLLDLPYSREYFLSIFHAAGLRPKIGERTQDLAVLRSLVANNYGYAILNIRPQNTSAPDGTELRVAQLDGAPRPIRLGLASAQSLVKTKLFEAFEDHCRSEITDAKIPGMAPLRPR